VVGQLGGNNEVDFKVNFNETVKVKLTDIGVAILKRQRDEINQYIKSRGAKGLGDYEPKIDDEGYTSFQLWSLMNHFGEVMVLGSEPPFEGDMIICNGKSVGDKND
jgi:hypothetical protein